MAVIATAHHSGKMLDFIHYRDHKIASFVHRTDGEFTIVRAPAPNGKFRSHAAWRCRGINFDAAKEWVDQQLAETA